MSSRTSVGALPTQPTISWPVSSATKSSRLSSGRSREQCPHRPPFQHDTIVSAREEDSNPPRLGRGDTRGSTEARDHFIQAPVAEQTTGIRLLNGTTQVQLLPGAPFLSTHRVCGPPVKRCELGAMPRGGAISQTERVRLVEEAVLKTVAPSKVSKVRVLGAPPSFIRPHGAIAARLVLNQETPEHYRVRVPFLHRPIAQKESGRLTSGRPRSVTSSGDHSSIPP